MGVLFFNAEDYNRKLKVTVQSSGRLGFSDETSKELDLSDGKPILLGVDSENDSRMFLVMPPEISKSAFRVHKSGDYFYLPTEKLFLSLNMDFKNNTVIYDITRDAQKDSELGGIVYVMNRRISPKKKVEKKKEGNM